MSNPEKIRRIRRFQINNRDDTEIVGEFTSRTRKVCSQLGFSVSVKTRVRAHDVIRADRHAKRAQPTLSPSKWSG